MHLLQTSSTTFDDLVAPVDLGQMPGDILALSFADSDLAALAAAYAADKDALPSLRLAHLRDLRHPMSVDLWIERCARHAKVVVVRLLGGLDWWRYGVEALGAVARARGIALAVLPGEDRDDARLAEASTLPPEELAALLAYFREGGRENLRALLRRLAAYAGVSLPVPQPEPLPRVGGYLPGLGVISLDRLRAECALRPPVPILFYRSALLAADTGPVDALCEALHVRGLSPAPLFVPSLKEEEAARFVRQALMCLKPAVVVTATAFAIGGDEEASIFDATDAPVVQAIIATTRRAAWRENPRGLGPADLAMHVVLPELDGRVLLGALAFKDALPADDALGFTPFGSRPEPDRIALVADRVAAWARLRALPRCEKRVAVLMPDYPGAQGRASYAVGLDVPASIVALLQDLAEAGYMVGRAPCAVGDLLAAVVRGGGGVRLSLAGYARLLSELPAAIAERIDSVWGDPADDPDVRDTSATFSSRCRRTAGGRASAVPPTTTRSSPRAMRSWRLGFGSAIASRPTPWCIWARTVRSNGCPARPWRSLRPASPKR